MSDPIERVARALCEAIGVPPDGKVIDRKPVVGESVHLEVAWRTQASKALAAIAEYKDYLDDRGIPIDKLLSGEMVAVDYDWHKRANLKMSSHAISHTDRRGTEAG